MSYENIKHYTNNKSFYKSQIILSTILTLDITQVTHLNLILDDLIFT